MSDGDSSLRELVERHAEGELTIRQVAEEAGVDYYEALEAIGEWHRQRYDSEWGVSPEELREEEFDTLDDLQKAINGRMSEAEHHRENIRRGTERSSDPDAGTKLSHSGSGVMTDDLPDSVRDALNDAKEAFEPPADPDELEPDYPAEMTPEERVEHVLTNEYPRWRGMEWIAAAADTDIEQAQSVVRECLSEGEVEVSGEGVRRNRYHVYFEEVEELTEKLDDRGQI